MQIQIDIGLPNSVNRRASVLLKPEEIRTASLSIAFGEKRNRTGLYMRRHPKLGDADAGIKIDANTPLRSLDEPKKLKIPDHIAQIFGDTSKSSLVSPLTTKGSERFGTQPAMLAVPVSDLTANLLRPCYSKQGLGSHRSFFFEDEPIDRKTYWAACFFSKGDDQADLKFMDVRFDPKNDCVLSLDGIDLPAEGLQWAAALVPLVKNGKAVPPVEIAQNDYDARQILGRKAEAELFAAYQTWFDGWDNRIEALVKEHIALKRPFEVFYHSVLGIDRAGNIRIFQRDADLPGLAETLAAEGIVAAGLLDSGGSCALYDPWLHGFLNHGWYYREPRGAILVFELKALERLPAPLPGTWSSGNQKMNP